MAPKTDPRLIQAMQSLAQGRVQEADTLCKSVLAERKRDDLAMAILAQTCNASGKYAEGMALIKKAIAKNNKRADYHGLLADMLTTQGAFKEALQSYDKALKLNPNHLGVVSGKANTWLRLRKPEKALALLAPIMNKGNEDVSIAIVYAKVLLENNAPMDAAEVLLSHVPAERESIEIRRTLYFVLGKAMEKSGEIASSFEAYSEGNAISPSGFHLDAFVQQHDDIIETFPIDSFSSTHTASIDASSIIFIVGMPRCGSTLTEQIIDAHPTARGLGELDTLPRLLHETLAKEEHLSAWNALQQSQLDAIAGHYMQNIQIASRNASVSLFVDKQLGNYQNIGYIKSLFPNAKIIHCTRNPLAIGLSCFTQKFQPNANSWASSLHSIGHFYNEYVRMMNHWKGMFGGNILEVSYESLVAHQEFETRKILDYCGLEFDKKCLEFWKSGRAVITLSHDQVSKPLYNSSVSRHEAFGVLLDPLRNALGI